MFFHNNGCSSWITGEGRDMCVVLYNWRCEYAAMWYRGNPVTIAAWAIVKRNNLKEKVTCYMGKLAAMHGEQMRMQLMCMQLIELDDDNVGVFEWFMNKVELLGTCQSMADRSMKATCPYHPEWFALYMMYG
ncbi:hypothetical protein E2562_026989 [Oryza meyeriana var. granulata]|uniref:Uncharacterized protein n=1 Tax=Oryza meyeriana var. granulata TaxID=110450 RepID=A0A6G1EPP7_9ORYZ|nr:hypothetical protein E2562_026989 [Oryza meyeriana var. granulata]